MNNRIFQYTSSSAIGNLADALSQKEGLLQIATRFVGFAFFYNFQNNPLLLPLITPLTFSVIIAFILSAWFCTKKLGEIFWMLSLLFLVSIALTSARISVLVIDPFAAGPHYFFYPYIFLYRLMIFLILKSGWLFRIILIFLLIQSLYISSSSYIRRAEYKPIWKDYIEQCVQSNDSEFSIPIHYDRKKENAWTLKLAPSNCRKFY